jgi:hypothetical protein
MCVDHSMNCACGEKAASFNFRDDVLPFEVITGLFCPNCAGNTRYNSSTMIRDNGWIIEYSMDVARFMLGNITPPASVTPELVFDEGYCSWRGVTPTDPVDSAREREEIVKLAKTDPKRYFEELRAWGTKRMERLARAGWRKANEREPVKA